jgi:BirA family biotin operon repressor/biotin-[acetyl-CoA-carboxylase] ligase
MSALVAPAIPLQSALRLSLSVAIAVQSAIASVAGFRIRDEIDIRWPNDLLLNSRKCAGILIETSAQRSPSVQLFPRPAMLRQAVIGIGINVNHVSFPTELDAIATSLRRERPDPSQPLRREPLVAAILIALDEEIRRLTSPGFDPTGNNLELTNASSWISGKRVRVEARDPTPGDPTPGYTGITAGLDPQGFLLVAGDDGQVHTVLSGGLREP